MRSAAKKIPGGKRKGWPGVALHRQMLIAVVLFHVASFSPTTGSRHNGPGAHGAAVWGSVAVNRGRAPWRSGRPESALRYSREPLAGWLRRVAPVAVRGQRRPPNATERRKARVQWEREDGATACRGAAAIGSPGTCRSRRSAGDPGARPRTPRTAGRLLQSHPLPCERLLSGPWRRGRRLTGGCSLAGVPAPRGVTICRALQRRGCSTWGRQTGRIWLRVGRTVVRTAEKRATESAALRRPLGRQAKGPREEGGLPASSVRTNVRTRPPKPVEESPTRSGRFSWFL